MVKKLSTEELQYIREHNYNDSNKLPVTIMLDNVRSLHNVGSVFRTSDAFNLESIVLCGITSTPAKCFDEIHKTALGAEESVSWIYSDNALETIIKYKNEGYKIIAVEQVENSIFLNDFQTNKDDKYLLVFGNEVNGVSQDIIDLCNSVVEIPQFGKKHSLNVSVSAGVVIWELSKQLRS